MTFSPYPSVSLIGPQPQDQGLVAWTVDPGAATGTYQLIAGKVALSAVTLRTMRVISQIWVGIATAGATLTANQNFAGVFDSNGNLLAQTADQSTAWTSAVTLGMSLTTPVSLAPGQYWVGLLGNGTTMPIFGAGSSHTSALNMGPSGIMRGASDGSALTALPTSFSPGALTANTLFCAGLS